MNAASQQLSVPKDAHTLSILRAQCNLEHECCKPAIVSAKEMHTCYPSFEPNAICSMNAASQQLLVPKRCAHAIPSFEPNAIWSTDVA